MFQRLYDRALLSVSNISNTFNHRGTAFKNNIKNIECGVFFIGYFCLQKKPDFYKRQNELRIGCKIQDLTCKDLLSN